MLRSLNREGFLIDSCVSIGVVFWKGTKILQKGNHLHTYEGRQERREKGGNGLTTGASLSLAYLEVCRLCQVP